MDKIVVVYDKKLFSSFIQFIPLNMAENCRNFGNYVFFLNNSDINRH